MGEADSHIRLASHYPRFCGGETYQLEEKNMSETTGNEQVSDIKRATQTPLTTPQIDKPDREEEEEEEEEEG